MGSGCTKTNSTPKCPPGSATSSHCVVWQGESYPEFGICTGDTITEVVESILLRLEEFARGEGITLAELTSDCSELQLKLKQTDYSLFHILQLMLSESCRLDSVIKQLNIKINNNEKVTVDTSCLGTGITTEQQLWEKAIQKICQLTDKINDITEGLDNAPDLNTLINNAVGEALLSKMNNCNGGITKTGTTSDAQLTFNAMIPIGGRIWGDFDITKFDNSGLGTGIFCGFAICNGKNGTTDLRGYSAAMGTNIPGVSRTFDMAANVGTNAGVNNLTITANNLPNHEHTITLNDPGHTHDFTYVWHQKENGGNFGSGWAYTHTHNVDENKANTTSLSTTGITVSASIMKNVKNTPIDNRQPTHYGVWIQRVK